MDPFSVLLSEFIAFLFQLIAVTVIQFLGLTVSTGF